MAEDIKKPQVDVTPDVTEKEGEGDGGKVFTQSEVDKILSERLSREKQAREKEKEEYSKQVDEIVKKALEEERRLSKMNEEEKEREMLEKQAKANAERERTLTLRENTLVAIDRLVEANIHPEKAKGIAQFLVNENLETQEKSVSDFISLFNETVATTVETKMKGTPPKDVNPTNINIPNIKPATFI